MQQIRAKRLAKLQAGSTSNSPTPSPASPGPSTPIAQLPQPKPKPPSIPPQSTTPPPQRNVPVKRKSTAPAPKVDYQTWENDTISTVLKVTLSVCSSLLCRSSCTSSMNRNQLQRQTSMISCGSSIFRLSSSLRVTVCLFYKSTRFTNVALLAQMTLTNDIVDRLLITRLELNAQAMS